MKNDSDYNNNLSSLRKELIRQNAELYELRQVLVSQNEELENNKSILIHQNRELQESKKRLEKSEEKYRKLFASMNEGLMICEFIYDKKNKPINFIIKEVNQAFEKITGISEKEALSSTADQLFGDGSIQESSLETYFDVTRTQIPVYFEAFNKQLDKYFGISVFSNNKDQFNIIFSDITERKISEKLLKLNKFAIENSSIATFWIDFDGKINYVNKYALEMLDYEKDNLMNTHFKTIYPRFTDDRWLSFKEQILSNKIWSIETELRSNDDSMVPVFITANLLEFKGKQYIFAYAQNISEIKAAQRQLDTAQNIFNNLANIVFDIIIMIDHDGTIAYWNQAAEKKIGYTKEEAIGANVADLAVPEKHRKSFIDSLKELIETGTGYYYDKTVEIEVQRKDGTTFIAESSSTTIKIDNKYYSLGILRDVTERNALNEKIRKTQIQQKAIMDSFPDYIWLKDGNGLFVETNKAFIDFLGLKKEDIVGKNVFDLFPKEIAEVFHADDLDIYKNPRMKIIEENVQLEGRPLEHYETIKIPILDDGKILGVSGISRNVTDRVNKKKKLLLTQHSIDNLPIGAMWLNNTGKYIAVNKKIEEMLGYSKEELLNMYVYEIDKELDKEKWKKRWNEIRAKKSDLLNRILIKKNGEEVPVEIYIYLFTYEDEEYLFAYLKDLTQKIETENKLRLIQYTIDNASVGSLWINKNGDVKYANQKIQNLFGYTYEECLNLNILDFEPKFTKEEWNSRWNYLKKQKNYTFITNMTSKTGTQVPVEVTTNYMVYEKEELIFGYIQDIKNKIELKNVISQKEKEFKDIFNASYCAVSVVNANGNFVFWNKSSEELFGYAENEVIGKNIKDICIPEELHRECEEFLEEFRNSFNPKELGKTFDLTLRKKDKTFIKVALRLSMVDLNNLPHLVITIKLNCP